MKPNELEEKIHELEEALNERMKEVTQTKTSNDEHEKLLAIQNKFKALLEDVDNLNGEDEKQVLVLKANELLVELRQSKM